MPDATAIFTYLAVLIGFVFIPGPSILLTLARATTSGTRVGLATSLGIGLGDLIHTLLAVVGVSAIVMASAEAFLIVKFLGAGYLIWIGIKCFREEVNADPGACSRAISPQTAFRQACLAEVLNPKSAMFFLAFLPQFVTPETGPVWSQLLFLGLLFVLIGTGATLTIALFAGSIGRFLRYHPVIMRWQGRIIGSLYCGLGIRLAFAPR
jgi:threonine/homoserine/homoserine lactone efflux protein